jgi:SAM-dependent methyltransferase
MTNEIASRVRDFYNQMPFNIREDVEGHVESNMNLHYVLEMYPTLKDLDLSKKTIIDVGCGVGWFANFLAYHYRPKAVYGLDFSESAITRAREISEHLGTAVEFVTADLFNFTPPEKFNIVISNGVLHHTPDCARAISRLCSEFLKRRGHACIGLYHRHGRKPFLYHFATLRDAGASEQDLFAEYRRLHSRIEDETHVMSWFRDQVLHPLETQHTAQEIAAIFAASGVRLVSTSVNEFGPITSPELLAEPERQLEEVGHRRLREGAYFPGFFTCIGRKQGIFGEILGGFSGALAPKRPAGSAPRARQRSS